MGTATTTDIPRYDAIILGGPPGSGKGTVGAAIVKEDPNKYHHISMGDLARDARIATEDGTLVDDATIIALLIENIKDIACDKTIIIDGFPRTEAQKEFLENRFNITKVVILNCSDETTHERAQERANNKPGRPYDKDKIQKRIDAFRNNTLKILESIKAPILIIDTGTKNRKDFVEQELNNVINQILQPPCA